MAQCNISGVVLLDKPYGMTSNQAVQKIKFLYASAKSGHTGTLDPLATGMLPICLGEATKFASVLLNAGKVYEAQIKLGYQSSTGDAEGEITQCSNTDLSRLNLQSCQKILQQFVGEIEQIPPMYSALKHQGKPLYAYARKGETLKRKPRAVHIYDITTKSLSGDELSISVHCGTGTYIRVLAEDIGKALGCGSAYLINLRRSAIDRFHSSQMKTFEMLTCMDDEQRIDSLLPVDSFLHDFPSIVLSKTEAREILHGRVLSKKPDLIKMDADASTLLEKKVRLYYRHFFLGLGEVTMEETIKPKRLLSDAYLFDQNLGFYL